MDQRAPLEPIRGKDTHVEGHAATEADDLGLDGGPLYDPLGNYRRVAGDISDWSENKKTAPVATSTVTAAEQPQGVTPASQ